MKLFIIFCYFHYTNSVYSREDLAKVPPVNFDFADATKTQISYYLFKSKSQTTAIVLNDDFHLPEEDRNKPTKLLIHGFTSNVTSPWYKEMKNAYFRKGPHNIIYIDWGIAANKSFQVSAANIEPVGEFIANFIISLKVPLDKVHIIGHSLGSHLAGFIGKIVFRKTGKKLSRITATDAAGPGFENSKEERRLNPEDAAFVDVIHTDIGYFGIIKPIGHVDFYVNGGEFQHGCPDPQVDDNCSHARSNSYFIESINKKNVTAVAAIFNDKAEVVRSSKIEEIIFGDQTPTAARGIYYLKTNSAPPYLMLRKIQDIESFS